MATKRMLAVISDGNAVELVNLLRGADEDIVRDAVTHSMHHLSEKGVVTLATGLDLITDQLICLFAQRVPLIIDMATAIITHTNVGTITTYTAHKFVLNCFDLLDDDAKYGDRHADHLDATARCKRARQ